MIIIEGWYIKDAGDGRVFISGMAIPRDEDGVTRNINFVNCNFHYASDGIFENCQIDGLPIPNGKGCLRSLSDKLERLQ